MADATPSRLGQVNAAGDALALFLKVFAGEVLAAFKTACVALPLTMSRSIQHGKSASFPATWKATAAYHVPGAEITGNAIKGNERVISIDGLLIAHSFLASIDEAMNHYDVRSIYSTELGQALARQLDKNLLQLAVLAARTATTVEDGNGGSTLTNAGYDTTADTLAQGILDAAQALDEKDVPETDRYCVLRPKHYNLLVQSSRAINRDWSEGNGKFSDGRVHRLAGVQIVKSNHVPNSNISQMTGTVNTYHGNFSNTVGVVFHKSAVGTVRLMDLAMEQAYDIRRQGTLMVAKIACGSGILRPEASVELKKA